MNKYLKGLMIAFALTGVILAGCEGGDQENKADETGQKVSADDAAALCGKCGFVKGTDECCKIEGKELCGKCGLVKGSPGCCKIEGKELCGKCGLVKGSAGCCK